MKFKNLLCARLKKRYKRFLVDVELEDGSELTVHCPNTGSMRGCLAAGNPVLLSLAANPDRKYAYTLEMIQVNDYWVGVNTSLTNSLVREGVENGVVRDFGMIDLIQGEVKVSARSRLDFLLHRGGQKIYMEVKNCTLVEGKTAMFPDAITSRGTKHLLELAALKKAGHGAAVFFCVQRMDGEVFSPAAHIDPLYARTLAEVAGQGVKVMAYQAAVGPREILLTHALPVHLP
ncbi:MAG: DNA/RNA nuclease SfsA [Deltaproteobacteria bacterium]|nr:DNA/RNA nuclease SfsA [Deltaproteobacteria bacterium]